MRRFAAIRTVLLAALVSAAPLAAQDDKKTNDVTILHALGGVSAQATYFTYGYIGLVSDAFVNGTYKEDQAHLMVGEAVAMLNSNRTSLEKLLKSGSLDAADAKAIEDFIGLFNDLSDYGSKVQQYIKDKTEARAKVLEEARQKSWKHLCKTLGIKSKD